MTKYTSNLRHFEKVNDVVMTIIKGKTQDGEEQYVYANPYRSP